MADEQIRIGLAVVSDAGTQKTLNDLAAVRKRIEDLKSEFRSGAKDVDTYTKELADLEKQANKLDKSLDSLGEKRRIDIETGQLTDPSKIGAGTGLRETGRNLRNLPSVQIPGAGFGTDAVGNIIRVSGSLVDLTEKSSLAAGAANLLTPALGAQTAATVAAYAPIGVLIAGFVAIGVAISKLVESTSQNVDRINSFAETQRELNTRIADGLDSTTAQEELARLTEAQERNRATLAKLQGAYDSATQDLGVLGGVARVFSGDEEALANQIAETSSAINDQQAEIDGLNRVLADGSLAANDAAEAEAKLAAERTQNVLQEASEAGQLASLKARASELTQEQIDKELESLEIRRAGVEAEIAALEASGDTSEAVAQKLKQLRDSLGFLGEQADVLNKARGGAKSSEAEKAKEKAAKEAEKEAERQAKAAQKRLEDTAKAQQNYTDKLADARVKFKDAIKDIGVSLKDNLADNLRKLDDDLRESTISFNEDQLKEEREYQRDLSSLKREAERAEKDAVRSRDFAALAEARQSAADAIGERQQTEDIANQEDLIAFQQHRAELARARQDADRDSRIDADRAARDARVQRERAFRDAATDRDRTLRDINSMEQNFQRQSLNGWQQYFSQLLNMQQNATGRQAAGTIGQATPGERRIAAGSNFNQLQLVVG